MLVVVCAKRKLACVPATCPVPLTWWVGRTAWYRVTFFGEFSKSARRNVSCLPNTALTASRRFRLHARCLVWLEGSAARSLGVQRRQPTRLLRNTLTLENARLCGDPEDGYGAYDPDGIQALVEALKVPSSSRDTLNLLGNNLGVHEAQVIVSVYAQSTKLRSRSKARREVDRVHYVL